MQPRKKATFDHDQIVAPVTDHSATFTSLQIDSSDRAASTFEDMAKASNSQTVKVDRGSDFLVGAADGTDPTPDYDEAIDELAHFMTDEYYPYFGEDRRSFDIGEDGKLTVNYSDLSKAGQKLAAHALEVWTTATGIEFKVVKKAAEITFSNDEPFAWSGSEVDGNTITSSLINISQGWMNNNGKGIYDYTMLSFIHEMGHALGLGHTGAYGGYPPPEDPPAPFANDSWQASIMSYNSQRENGNIDADYAIPITPMTADLVAIRDLYDIEDLRTGNDVYKLKDEFKAKMSLTIVDDGGLDRLDLSWSKKANVIDLTEESASSINGVKGNMLIARGTVIEAAVGGTAGDTIVGNDYANALYGNLGNDTLTGNDGEDFFVFDTKPAEENADTITDITIGEDTLVFNNAIFKKLGADGALPDTALAINETGLAGDSDDRLIYQSTTGKLFYDADGSVSAKSAILVATIGSGLDLSATDILII